MIFNENLNRETMPPPAIEKNFTKLTKFKEKKKELAE